MLVDEVYPFDHVFMKPLDDLEQVVHCVVSYLNVHEVHSHGVKVLAIDPLADGAGSHLLCRA